MVGVDTIVVVMEGNGLRNRVGENQVLTHHIKPLTIHHVVDVNFRIVMVLGNEVPTTSIIKPS